MFNAILLGFTMQSSFGIVHFIQFLEGCCKCEPSCIITYTYVTVQAPGPLFKDIKEFKSMSNMAIP